MQLALDLRLHSEATFNNFVAGSNAVVIDVLKKMSLSDGELSCFVWGHSGEGVSHILQAVCHEARHHGISSMYLPLKECKTFGFSLFNGLEEVSVVCLDDIDSLTGDKDWEEALFHCFNRIREKGGRLIVGAHHSNTQCGFQLQDLLSRLAWGVSYKLQPLNDQEKIDLLQLNAKRRGFALSLDIAKYLLAHYPRDLRTQFDFLEKLDILSLQEKHKVTLPFVKSVLVNFP